MRRAASSFHSFRCISLLYYAFEDEATRLLQCNRGTSCSVLRGGTSANNTQLEVDEGSQDASDFLCISFVLLLPAASRRRLGANAAASRARKKRRNYNKMNRMRKFEIKNCTAFFPFPFAFCSFFSPGCVLVAFDCCCCCFVAVFIYEFRCLFFCFRRLR